VINTHEKLVEEILQKGINKKQVYKILAEYGYKGNENYLIVDFLCAIGVTDAYMYNSQKVDCEEHLIQEEYFQVLINDMNLNY